MREAKQSVKFINAPEGLKGGNNEYLKISLAPEGQNMSEHKSDMQLTVDLFNRKSEIVNHKSLL